MISTSLFCGFRITKAVVAFQKQYRIFSQLRVAKHDYISDLKKSKEKPRRNLAS